MNENPAPVNAKDLPEHKVPPKSDKIVNWIVVVTSIVALVLVFFVGFFTAKNTIEPVQTTQVVEKEVPTVPLSCHKLILNYGEQIDIYKEFMDNIQLELAGIPSGTSYYESLGNKRIALDNATPALITECNKYL